MKKCPQCGGAISRVPSSNWMTDEQYAAVKAGDWFCKVCPDNGRGNSGLCYWWSSEVEAAERASCDAIMHT